MDPYFDAVIKIVENCATCYDENDNIDVFDA
jgi:hypothetical protein